MVISIVGAVFLLLALLIPLAWNFLWQPAKPRAATAKPV
jgi:hypothetical protein